MRVLGDECFPQRAGTGGRCALPSWVSKQEPAGGSRGGPGEARGTTACPQARNSCRPAPSAQVGCLRRVEANSCFHISRVGALHETHSHAPPPLSLFLSGFQSRATSALFAQSKTSSPWQMRVGDTEFMLVSVFIHCCILFHTNNGKPMFAPLCVYMCILRGFSWLQNTLGRDHYASCLCQQVIL